MARYVKRWPSSDLLAPSAPSRNLQQPPDENSARGKKIRRTVRKSGSDSKFKFSQIAAQSSRDGGGGDFSAVYRSSV